jgi:flagellar hook-associated protein 3 FlgL
MRISDRILVQQSMQGLRSNLEAVARAQRESASGRRIETVSDDPVDAAQIMRITARLRDVNQFQRNSSAANTRLSTEDAVLNTLNDLMSQAKEFAVSGAVDDASDPARQDALRQVNEILKQVISLGNTKVGDEYIFAGGRTDQPAFQADGSYAGDTTVRRAEIDEQMIVDTNHTGDQLFGPAIQSLQDLSQQLATGTAQSIRATQAGLDAARVGGVANQAEVGSRLREIQNIGTNLTTRTNVLSAQEDSIRNVDPTEAAAELVSSQNALERAYAVVGRVLQNTILNYLTLK